jgi:hypothetical protein
LPAFLLSRKHKSLRYFFTLLRIYKDRKISIETLWSNYDTDGYFNNLKTLRSYFCALSRQIDEILSILSSHVVTLDTSIFLEDITPDKKNMHRKLEVLFTLIDRLLELLHQKDITGMIINDEKCSFIHAYLFQKAQIIFLDSS